MKRLCNARLRCKPGLRCRKPATAGMLRCRLHGGVPTNGKHLGEDAHHSISFGKARAARGPLYPLDPSAAGKARAQRAPRGTDGKFLPGSLYPPHPDPHVRKALRIVEKLMTKDARLQVVPADSGRDDDVAPEPRGAPLVVHDAIPEPPTAATEASAEAPPESPPSAEELLEALIVVLLDDEPDEDEGPSLWTLVADAMPSELYSQLDRWLEHRWL